MVAHHERLKPGALAARSSLSLREAGCEMSMHGVAVLVSIRAAEVAGSLPPPWNELFARVARKTIEVRCQLRQAKLGEDTAAYLQDRDFSITAISFEGLSLARLRNAKFQEGKAASVVLALPLLCGRTT